jgi:Ca2+-binding RTX toxin-like protein
MESFMRTMTYDSGTDVETDTDVADPLATVAAEPSEVTWESPADATSVYQAFTWTTWTPKSPLPPIYFTPVATEGNDFLWGTPNDDSIDALGGNDVLTGSLGADHLNGGDGFDTVDYSASALGVMVDMARGMGFTGDAEGDTYVSIERVVGSQHGDVIVGNHNGMTLEGGNGDDWLSGGLGNDRIVGGAGNDTLRGDIASGTVRDPGGVDQFVLGLDTGRDLIVDFEVSKDKIVLPGITAEEAFGADGELAWGYYDGDRDLQSANFRGDRLFYDVELNQLCEVIEVFHDGKFLGVKMDPIAQFTTDVQLHTYDFAFF